MSKFGWSYPPGCSGTPFDEDHPCEVCLRLEDDCKCPECPTCGEVGRPACQTEHGLIIPPEVLASAEATRKQWAESAEAQARFEAEMAARQEAEFKEWMNEDQKD